MAQPQHQDPIHILVLDDNPSTRGLAKLALERHLACEVDLCATPEDLLSASTPAPPDLYLLDVSLGETSGIDVCQRLKEDPTTASVPIVFLSAYKDPAQRVAALKAGGVDYLDKPFYPEELVARVKNHIEMHRLRVAQRERIAEQQALLRVLCHDLVNPVFGAHSLLSMRMARGKVDSDTLQLVLDCCQSAMDVIENARSQHQLVADGHRRQVDQVAVSEAFAEAQRTLQTRFESKDVVIKISIQDDATLPIKRVALVHSILNNLLTNALKFSYPKGEVTLTARLTGQAAQRRCLIEIRDQGVGMPPEILDRLFDESAAVSRSGTAGESGTGFGMPLVKRYVEEAGGSLEVQSVEQAARRADCPSGTLVSLRFPII